MGAEQVKDSVKVRLWDTLTLSGGERYQVLAAALAIKAGWPWPAIQERLSQIRAQNEVIFTLETLEYLARGGRIGRVQAMAGMLLNIKPIIHVDHEDGKYDSVGKSRTLAKCLSQIVDHLQHLYGTTPVWLTVEHGRLPEQAMSLGHQLRQRLNVVREDLIRVSPVLGVHTGPGIVGAAVLPMRLMEDLLGQG